jgi:hypothetical protein
MLMMTKIARLVLLTLISSSICLSQVKQRLTEFQEEATPPKTSLEKTQSTAMNPALIESRSLTPDRAGDM